MTYQTIRDYMYAHRSEITADLFRLSRIPSVRSDAQPNAPFGTECRRVLEEAVSLSREYGFSSAIDPSDMFALTTLPGDERTIGLFGHADVVPVGEGWTITQPFEPIEWNGCLVGRGVSDNKSGVIASLWAAKAIRELGLPMQSSLLLFTGSNEESGMADIRTFRDTHPMPDVSLVPDTRFPAGRGEKGIMRFWAESGAVLHDILSFDGGEAFNIILGNLDVRLRYRGDLYAELSSANAERIAVRRDGDEIVVSAEGMSKHAAHPEDSINAAYLAAKLLADCQSLHEDDRAAMAETAGLLADPWGGGFGIAADDPELGQLTCANGMVSLKNGHLRLSFDVRYGTTVDSDELERKIDARLSDAGWTFELNSNRPGFLIPTDNPYLAGLLDMFGSLTGCEAKGNVTGGGTYARYLVNAFSVGTELDASRPDLPAGHGGAHQPDEVICVDGLLNAAAMLTMMLLRLDELLHK
ncbi:MAG: Sapep family Mn(2+)-dependent dipeptidase [Clostridia bacterium]|nr:Sapep family Mn(2+)-dependent dipeptidase [Clostridia bacterium]